MYEGASEFSRPSGKRFGFGAFHVGFVAGQPEQPGSGAQLFAYRDAAPFVLRSNVEEFQAVIIHGHGLGAAGVAAW